MSHSKSFSLAPILLFTLLITSCADEKETLARSPNQEKPAETTPTPVGLNGTQAERDRVLQESKYLIAQTTAYLNQEKFLPSDCYDLTIYKNNLSRLLDNIKTETNTQSIIRLKEMNEKLMQVGAPKIGEIFNLFGSDCMIRELLNQKSQNYIELFRNELRVKFYQVNHTLKILNTATAEKLVYYPNSSAKLPDSEYKARELLIWTGRVANQAVSLANSIKGNLEISTLLNSVDYYTSLAAFTFSNREYFVQLITQDKLDSALAAKAELIFNLIMDLAATKKSNDLTDIQKQYDLLAKVYDKTEEYVKAVSKP